MGTLVRLIFCALVISGKMLTVQSAVYSTPHLAMKFSQCLIEKMSESRFFTFGDRNSMTQVADVMSQALLNKQQTVFSGKILVVAFVTSMADVIVSEEAAKNAHRKDVYASALEQCSLSTTGYVDTEFVNEALRIMSAIERSKISKFVETSAFSTGGVHGANAHAGNIFNPLSVQPSRVQPFYAPDVLYPNGETTFEHPEVPYGSMFSSSSQSGMNSGYPVQSAGEIGLPARSGAFGLPQPGSMTAQQSDTSSISHSPTPQQGFRTGNLPQYDTYSSVYDTSGISQPENIPPGMPSNEEKHDSFPLSFDTSDVSQPGSSSSNFEANNPPQIFSGSDASRLPQLQSLPSSPDFGSLSESGSEFIVISPSEVSGVGNNTSDIGGASLESLSIPQTKESSVIVLPPKDPQKTEQIENVSKNFQTETSEIIYPPSGDIVYPSQESAFPKTASASLPQISEENTNISGNPTFENILFNLLTNSSSFREAFSPEIPKENAINLARSITEQSLAGYDFNLINQALISVSDEISKVATSSPENYALALSNALASVLKFNNLPVFVEGSYIADSFLSNLDKSHKLPPEEGSFEEPRKNYPSEESSYPDWEEKQVDFDFQAPPLSPDDTDEEIVSQSLARYLSNSEEFANFFCSKNTTEDRVKIYFTIVKDSLIDYGLQISSMAAGIASSVLSELSQENLCSNYAVTIAEVIAEVLDENGIHNANALDIAKKMEFSLGQQKIILAQAQQTENVSNSSSVPAIQSSLESFEQPELDVNASSIYFNRPPGYSNSSAPGQKSSTETSLRQETKNDTASSVTTPTYTTEISEEDFTRAMTLSDTIDDLSAAYATNNPTEIASEDVIDQEALAEYLYDAFESGLAAYTSKDEEQTEASAGTVVSAATENTAATSESDKPQSPANSQVEAKNRPRSSQNRRRKKKKRATQQPDILTSPSVQAGQNEGFQDESSTLSGSSTEDGNSQAQPGSGVAFEDKFDPQTNVKLELVELQPSFQNPIPEYSDSSSSPQFQQTSGTAAYNLNDEDASVTFAREVSQIAASTIAYIRSENVNIAELCGRLNDLAPLVNIPPLDYCNEVAAIDYLLNVLRSMTYILKGV